MQNNDEEGWAVRTPTSADTDTDYFRRVFAESQRKRQRIIDDVRQRARPGDDLEWLTSRELYQAGLISASELHATGSPELLPKGWYYHHVDGVGSCPTRVWGLDEVRQDPEMFTLYEQGYRWITVFSELTGPSGDRTFIHIQDFAAAFMTENPVDEPAALEELADIGYRLNDLTDHIRIDNAASAPPMPATKGWYADPARRFHWRWWDGQTWTEAVSNGGPSINDPL